MYGRYEFGIGGGGGTALRFDRPLAAASFPVHGGLGRARPRAAAPPFSLVVDLGSGIGSRRWWQGLGTCLALCLVAAAFAPDMRAIAVPAAAPLGDAQWAEARALGVAPLGLGADTGRRMAPTDAVRTIDRAPERPTIDLLATLGRGDRFARVLERSGVSNAEAAAVEAMIARVASPAAIRPGTPMEIRLGRRPAERAARPLERLSFRAALDMQVVVARQDGRLVLQPLRIAVDDTPLRISGRVGASLYFSARAAGVPAKAVEAYIRTLSGQMSLGRDIAADDRFDIVVSHRRTASGEAESGRLLYAGLDRAAGRDVQLLPWTVDGETRWYEASGVGRTTGSMSQPVAGRITSGFGMRRHPILRFARMHRGVDFAAGYGQPIYAATAGQVVRTGWAGGYGKQVRIAHDGGLLTSYSHMSRIVAEPGAAVRQGQVIGYVGSTGLSTGPHLHYELYRNGVAINPLSVRFVTRSLLEGAELQAFQARLREMTALKTGRPDRT
ncbi:MAG TPA: peptidoglycan DD-metalloendopeptidase family protein [Sphingomonadaceae bacterium]|nr:peptidoglycan DD-metalloendopeptidase family protein [Sphingomonadaceae bacterium]